MTKEKIYLAAHDNLVRVPHNNGWHIVYEFLPEELVAFVQKLLSEQTV